MPMDQDEVQQEPTEVNDVGRPPWLFVLVLVITALVITAFMGSLDNKKALEALRAKDEEQVQCLARVVNLMKTNANCALENKHSINRQNDILIKLWDEVYREKPEQVEEPEAWWKLWQQNRRR